MFSSLFRLVITGALVLAASPLFAQSATSALVAYTGPRYPGGPDSLRALVGRSTSMAAPAPDGQMLVQFQLRSDGQPHGFTTIRPLKSNKPLAKAAAMAMHYLEAHMLPWQLGPSDGKTPNAQEPIINLPLDFIAPPASQPYYYADQNPVFSPVVQYLRAQYTKDKGRPMTETEMQESFTYGASAKGLAHYIQIQFRYPPQALRNGESGTVYAYFEVAETGAVERPTIIGSAGSSLDAEVLRLLSTLPTATTPALLNGQPVRVYYAIPVTFKIR